MHNVPKDKIFRPAVWNAFGADKEGQAYRACATFGPRFKKCNARTKNVIFSQKK